LGIVGIAFLHPGCAALVANKTQCMSNVKRLGLAVLAYAQDFDEHFPVSARWSESVAPYMDSHTPSKAPVDKDVLRRPSAESPWAYGMNSALSGISMSKIQTMAGTVLLFDADAPIRSFAGGAKDLDISRHMGAPNVAFSDGHVKNANEYVRKKLLWLPADEEQKQ